MSYNGTTSRFKSFCTTNGVHDLLEERTDNNHNATVVATTSPTRSDHIPQTPSMATDTSEGKQTVIQCCCGRSTCAYLEHNNAALGGLERDLKQAARLGQALLSRHESYIASSRLEHTTLLTQVSTLESEKATLQSANEAIVAENRELLDKLDLLNNKLGDSEVQVKSLEVTLVEATYEVSRLTRLAARAEELERQLIQMESDRARLLDVIDERKEDSRSALARWREAEGRVRELELEVGRIEREREERHVEVLGRRKTAPDTGTGGSESNGVVGHFVRDILQDNATLQAGIVELRELLQTSNEEVQNLREQILMHQPLSTSDENGDMEGAPSLEDQLSWAQSKPPQQQRPSQEVHVHHHYHAKISAARKDRMPVSPRRRKRSSFGLLSSTPEPSVPSTPLRHASSPLIPALPTIHQPKPRTKRWSVQSGSTTTGSSMPSSPRSYFDRMSLGSIFDRIEHDLGEESSTPTSPESAASPRLGLGGCRKGLFQETEVSKVIDEDHKPRPIDSDVEDVSPGTEKLVESGEDDDSTIMEATTSPTPIPPNPDLSATESEQLQRHPQSTDTLDTDADIEDIPTHTLRRTHSNDSLLSISGMDIHLAKRKPSQLFGIQRPGLHPSLATPKRTISASQPLASIAEVTASSAKRAYSNNSQSLAMLSGIVSSTPRQTSQSQTGLGGLLGGWVRGRWGVAPVKSTGDLRATPTATAKVNFFAGRTPGINQRGAIPGLRPPVSTPSQVHVTLASVHEIEGLLAESLTE